MTSHTHTKQNRGWLLSHIWNTANHFWCP